MISEPGEAIDIIDFYKSVSREDLVMAYKHYCTTNNKLRKKSDGFGNDRGNGLERPKISGETYSWTQFSKLPKDAIIVHTFMLGIDRDYLQKLVDDGFFIAPEKEERVFPWETEEIPYLEWLWANNEDYATKMHPSVYGYPPHGVRGQNYWKWMDKHNPNQNFGPNWEEE